MKKPLTSPSTFFRPRVLISFAFSAMGFLIALAAFSVYSSATAQGQGPAPLANLTTGPLTAEEARRMAERLEAAAQ